MVEDSRSVHDAVVAIARMVKEARTANDRVVGNFMIRIHSAQCHTTDVVDQARDVRSVHREEVGLVKSRLKVRLERCPYTSKPADLTYSIAVI